jgi:hypothetical protein
LRATWVVALAAAVAPWAAVGATIRPETAAVYSGLGSWVDIFATQAWRNPDAVVASLRAHGIRTLYLETSNYRQPTDIVEPAAVGRFVDDAHAAGLKVVAWYLPSLADPGLDSRRALAAIRFRSAAGQSFDSFALDIEAAVVRNVQLRDARLIALARKLRAAAPPGYPLGAIVPSPVGMARHRHYWPHFPFAPLAETFDVFVPMAYFSYYAKTPAAAYAYARDVVLAIRRKTGRPAVPIHIIGGIANRAGIDAVEGFIRAASDCGVAGISLYAFLETSSAQWSHLQSATLGARPTPSCTP